MRRKLKPLIRKYEEISRLTRPQCMTRCPEPGACCRPEYCAMAGRRAEQFGIALPHQPHSTLIYMGKDGCIVPPYLRPLCAVHVCEHIVIGDEKFADSYFAMREEVCRTEEQWGPGWPEGMVRDYWE